MEFAIVWPKIRTYNLNAVEFDLSLETVTPYLHINVLACYIQISISKLYLVSTVIKTQSILPYV